MFSGLSGIFPNFFNPFFFFTTVMPMKRRDVRTYRRDEKFGHSLLTPDERVKLLKVCS